MIIAVDFDGTLCESAWPNIGNPNRKLIKHLVAFRDEGNQVILWTSREGEMLTTALAWCEKYGLSFDAVNDNLPEMQERFGGNSRKVFANLYIDDKNADDRFVKKFHVPYKEEVSTLMKKF